jgi:FkbM family methyltransferase
VTALGLLKPEYLFRPRNVLARLRYRDPARLPARMSVSVFGRPFAIDPHEVIGRHILHFGLFDLLVSEVLFRLADPGETALDVGANIGFMTRLLAERVGASGRVYAFEPHPEIFAELQGNASDAQVTAIRAAASDRPGTAMLNLPLHFDGNRGIASLEPAAAATATLPIECVTLDAALPADCRIGLVKIDVEGHELKVLEGATRLLAERRIRDIVFEEHDTGGSPLFAYLASKGFTVLRLVKGFAGPRLREVAAPVRESGWESPSYLATLDSARATERLAPGGWRVLHAV